ncbi:MAG: tetratricopeptide repeat-containing protein [Pseudomonadota bacterium]
MTTLPTKILQLARAGNPVRAWGLFGDLGLGDVTDDVRTLTLKGRLLKDLAWRASGEERAGLFRESYKTYLAAYTLKADSYPLINAASLALFSGDAERSGELAQQVLDVIDNDADEGETPFWREATRAEALLLLGEQAKAKAALDAGRKALPEAWEDHARTVEQFTAIIDAKGGDTAWLDQHRPPCSIHFCGLIGLDPGAAELREEIDAVIGRLRPGFAFGALAAGADIMIAEAAVAAGARLFVTLPNSVEEFRTTSVEPFGADWPARFDALIEGAERVDHVAPSACEEENPFALSVDTASLVSMGQAIRNADILSSHAHALTIVAPGEIERMHVRVWRESGRPQHVIETPRAAAASGSGGKANDSSSDVGLCAIVRFEGVRRDTAERVVDELGLSRLALGADEAFVGEPRKCLAAMDAIARREGTIKGALLIDVFSPKQPDPMIVDRTNRLLQAAADGQILTDYQSAMIARVLAGDLRVEEFGELASLSGPISLWSVNP